VKLPLWAMGSGACVRAGRLGGWLSSEQRGEKMRGEGRRGKMDRARRSPTCWGCLVHLCIGVIAIVTKYCSIVLKVR